MNTPKIGIIIQARMNSSRLPGKVLKSLNGNETVLDILIKRLKACKLVDEIIIATTPTKDNILIIEKAKSHDISYFIGSENNVLERYFEAARDYKLSIVIRICSDNPFIDPEILDDLIDFYKNKNYDYVRTNSETSKFPLGFLMEIFSYKTLEKVYTLATEKSEKEHVTYYIYNHPEIFSIFEYKNPEVEKLEKYIDLRLTIDEKEDLFMCRQIYRKLKEKGKSIDFSIFDIIKIIKEEPELMNINKHISQKTL